MTRDEAMALAATEWWKACTPKEIVERQLYEDRIIMCFECYQKALEETLGRAVFTHEFCEPEKLQVEFEFIGR